MLESTLQTEFVPGTNLAGRLARTSWRFLLPRLRFNSALCVGTPSALTLEGLSTMSNCVLLIAPPGLPASPGNGETQTTPANVCTLRCEDFPALQIEEKSVGLAVLAGRPALSMLQDPVLAARVCSFLADNAVVYLETNSTLDWRRARRALKRLLSAGFTVVQRFWLTPLRGELRTAFPLAAEKTSGYVFRALLPSNTWKKRVITHAGGLLSQGNLLRFVAPRRAVLVRRQSGYHFQAPEYLWSLAANSGVDLSHYYVGLSARGLYDSNKTILFLFRGESKEPEIVVKITRGPEFNYRLENEHRVLSSLREKQCIPPGMVPKPVFFGYEAGLAVLGQAAVQGDPFRRRTRATPDCPVAHAVVGRIVALGTAPSGRSHVPAARVGSGLLELWQRFIATYRPMPYERDFLREQIMVISRAGRVFPLVFQHGDPGTWNILVSGEREIALIDWEAGEPRGMPLWDLFYFMKSFANWISRKAGLHDPVESFRRNFLQPSALNELLKQIIEEYRHSVGLEEHLIAPLFHTCWMHRALKEATRLRTNTLDRGHYFTVVRLCVAHSHLLAQGLARSA